jgi:23S rRNA pseudouridine2605 synthase
MRINKYIASCGVCSRRAAEELIKAGKVKINGKTVEKLATEVAEENDTVTVDGQAISLNAKPVYIMLHKPKGCVCTVSDDLGRKTVMDYVTEFKDTRVFPVGRLDYDTEGLLLMTNDGAFANGLTAPINEVEKTYVAVVEGFVSEAQLATLRRGIIIDSRKTKLNKCRIKVLEETNDDMRLEITLKEGKNRQIHKMFDTIGHKVLFLKRIRVDRVALGGLSRGAWRYLNDDEIEILKRISCNVAEM